MKPGEARDDFPQRLLAQGPRRRRIAGNGSQPRPDLERFPRNGWSFFGLAESLARQGKTAEARRVRAMFAQAWKDADVVLTGSRF